MEKGLLSKPMEVKIGEWLDEQVTLSSLWETIDGPAFKLAITQLDNNFGEKIPSPYKEALQEQIILIFEDQNYESAIVKAMDFVDQLWDVPYIDDESEKLLFQGLGAIIAGIVAKLNTK